MKGNAPPEYCRLDAELAQMEDMNRLHWEKMVLWIE